MHKYLLAVVLLLAPCLFAFADGGERENRFTLGAGFIWTNNPQVVGGHADFGIVLYKDILFIQNNFLIRAGGMSIDGDDHSIFTLSDKLIFGRNSDAPLRIYTYIECGTGIYGNADKKFFSTPLAFTFGFGGGGELVSEQFGGLYIEVGYIGQGTNLKYPVSGVIIQTGWRIYF
ncbi:MAG: hypothetical protein LBO65_07940 [Spirochaetaceae bacterium]|jgi:hypothetical protein|nr:hypothetical protein [Spirochaetaceae bacterium]